MRLYAIIAVATGLLLSQAKAEDDPSSCAAIASDPKRLECFDLIFKKSSSTTTVGKSEWIVTEEKSKIDDSTNVFLRLNSIEPIRNQFGVQTNVELYILCREKKTDFYMVFGGHFMSSIENYSTVTFRLDKRSPSKNI
jgi:type VI secretion system protein VasI